MRCRTVFVILACCAALLPGCSRHSKPTIADIDSALLAQFRTQWREKRPPEDRRDIEEVHIGQFYRPSGSDLSYVELEVVMGGQRIVSGSPIVLLGTSTFGISFEIPATQERLNAVVRLD
jgi:hypothetical protein